MEKMRALIGLPVLELGQGSQIGEVCEVVIGFTAAKVLGVLITGQSWLSERRFIKFANLYAIGRDAVIVRNHKAVEDFGEEAAGALVTKLCEITEKAVYSETGNFLGVLSDVVYDPFTGEVRGFELSDGFIADFLQGRTVMPLPKAQLVNAQRVIVPEESAKLLQASKEFPGGVVK